MDGNHPKRRRDKYNPYTIGTTEDGRHLYCPAIPPDPQCAFRASHRTSPLLCLHFRCTGQRIALAHIHRACHRKQELFVQCVSAFLTVAFKLLSGLNVNCVNAVISVFLQILQVHRLYLLLIHSIFMVFNSVLHSNFRQKPIYKAFDKKVFTYNCIF